MNWQYMFCYMTVDVVCAVVALIIMRSVRGDGGSEAQTRSFLALVGALLLFILADMAWAACIIGHFVPMNSPLVLGLNAVTRFAAALAGYFWFCYGELHLGRTFLYRPRARIVALAPMLVALALYAIGLAFGITFVEEEDGTLGNGPLYTIITLVGLLYLIIVTVDSFVHAVRASSHTQRRKYLTFAAFMIAPVAASIIDVAVPDMPVMAPAMLISIVLVMLQLQDSRISTDALTGLNNRRRTDEYLEEKLPHATAENPLYLFLIDMNRFKHINDTYGHLEGDHALQTMAEAPRRACTELDAFAARWGGDEFVVVCTHSLEGGPDRGIQSIKEHLAEQVRVRGTAYELSCSIGFAECTDSSTDARALVQDADRSLYLKKQRASEQ